MGIARCFTFGGKRNKPLFDVREGALSTTKAISHEAYVSQQNTKDGSSLEHFYEKVSFTQHQII